MNVGDRIGLWNHDGWVPAVVIGTDPASGYWLIRTVADPNFAAIMAKRPGYDIAFDPDFSGVEMVLYPDAITWLPASQCVFWRVVPSTAWTVTLREWERWDPWPEDTL